MLEVFGSGRGEGAHTLAANLMLSAVVWWWQINGDAQF